MALPTQEIERLTRGSSAEQGPYKQLLLLAGSLFAISLILYLGLAYGYEPYLNAQKENLDGQIQEFSKQIPQEDQAKLIAFYSQLANIKTLLAKHSLPSTVFGWLERNTQTRTHFTKLTFNASTNQITILGNSATPGDVAEQTAIFESQPEVLRLNLNNLSSAPGGGWQFGMNLFLDPKPFLASTLKTSPAPVPGPASTSTTATTTQTQ